jgi:hypothetical protein
MVIDLDFLIDLDWPDEPQEYRPDIEVFPLTN